MRDIIAKSILGKYNIYPTVVMSKKLDVKGMYLAEEDKIILRDINEENPDPKDFVMTVLHEGKHAIDARRIGIRKFIKKYAQAGNVAVYCNRDYYKDNKWEIKAENWAVKEYEKTWRLNDISEEDKK